MKKSIKILIIIIVVIGVFIGLMYLNPIINDWKLNNERINDSKTLTRYIENHDQWHTYAMNETFEFLGFAQKGIETEVLKNTRVLYYDYRDDGNGWILVLDNNKIYETVWGTDRIYSNNKQYKEVELDVEVKRIEQHNTDIYVISKNDKCYRLDKNSMELNEIDDNYLIYILLKDDTIKKVIMDFHNNKDVYTEYLVLKTDGQVYKQSYGLTFNHKTNKSEYPLLKEEVYLSSAEYGKIIDVEGGNNIRNSANSTISNEERGIIKIVSDNGLYYLKQTNTEETKKYADIKPIFEMSKSEIYEKYKEDILTMNCDYVFTKDGNVINTGYLCNPLDKEVK